MSKHDSFEFGGEPTRVNVTIRDQSRVYLFNDISKRDAEDLMRPLVEAKGDPDLTAKANIEISAEVITKIVTREDGTPITSEEVGRMRAALANKLSLKCLAFLNNGDVDAAGEKDVPESVGPKA